MKLMSGWIASVLAGVAMIVSSPVLAQGDSNGADAVEGVPPEIPTSAFASLSMLSGARLSPDGSMIAFTTMHEDELYLTIFSAETLEFVNGAKIGDRDNFNWFRWVGDDHIIFSVMLSNSRETYFFSRLMGFELSTQALQPVGLRRMAYDGDDVIHVNHDNAFILVSMQNGVRNYPDVYRFDLGNLSAGEPEGVIVERRDEPIVDWITDDAGTVRMGVGRARGGRYFLRYRSGGEGGFRTIAETRADDENAFDFWDIRGLRAGRDTAYVLARPTGADRNALMEIDLATGSTGAVVFQSEDADVSSVYFDDDGEPIAVGYSGDEFRRDWIDPELRDLRDALGRALPGSWVTILDWSDDRERMLILQSGPADPGALYVFTPGENRMQLFAEYRPQVPASLLVEPTPLRYDARDGTSIHAYLTLPRGRAPEGLPLIVHPHGGPFGIRDTNRYNDMVQMLANRGYAVIQPNFRGSGGYGEAFELLGNGQIGRRMQDDLDDAVAHLVTEGIVDPDRVCIVGSSYGGFAAMWGVIRNPEIYRCAVSFAGVTHFERQLNYDSNYLFGRNRGRWWDRVDGDQTNFDLDDVSPAVQVARLTRPLLLVHGEEDDIVPFSQYELMVSRAERADIEIETLTFEESGHNFTSEEDEQAYYDAITAFLAEHNPAD